jgi:hypothetical protein
MAYVTINPNTIDPGDPITADLFGKIKDNFDDHETRINSLEGVTQRVQVFNQLVVNNTSNPALVGKEYFTVLQNMTITECYVQIFTKGSLTGSLEIDVQKASSLGGSYSSIFSTKPKIVYASAANYDKSSNQIFNAGASVVEGDVLRFDLSTIPGGGVLDKFIIVCYGEI